MWTTETENKTRLRFSPGQSYGLDLETLGALEGPNEGLRKGFNARTEIYNV